MKLIKITKKKILRKKLLKINSTNIFTPNKMNVKRLKIILKKKQLITIIKRKLIK